MTQQELELPKGWSNENLGIFSEIIMGQAPPSSTYNKDGNGKKIHA